MIVNGKRLESEYYYPERHSHKSTSEKDFWQLLHKINFYAMEASITLSTIIAVVVKLQMKQSVESLRPIHYLIAGL